MTNFGKVVIFFSVINLALLGCGQQKFVALTERQVPAADIPEVAAIPDTEIEVLDSIEEQVQEQEEALIEEVSSEEDEQISLREKILSNSDVNEKALDNAFEYFDNNQESIKNQKYMTIFDIGRHSGQRRFHIINLETGTVSDIHVAHGKKSDTNHDGIATAFSNVSGSHKSSLGFMLTAERYYGKHGLSMRLDGLENRNSRVRPRAIVVHGASYVSTSRSKMGRSLGCPAVSNGNSSWVVKALEDGSLFYIFHADHD